MDGNRSELEIQTGEEEIHVTEFLSETVESQTQVTQLKEDNEMLCRSKHIPSFKLTLKKIPLGDLLHT